MRVIRFSLGIIVAAGLILAALPSLAAETTSPPKILVEKTVTVGGNGGSAEVFFTATKGQRIAISLAAPSSVEPYGFLEKAGAGNGEYKPALENAKAGKNAAELTISRAGKYSLTVFDGSNAGGEVRVLITEHEMH